MFLSMESILVLIALSVLGLGMLYAFKGPLLSHQWTAWVIKASLAAAAAFSVGTLLVGLPGAMFLELVIPQGRKLPLDSTWPLAIMITQVGALLIVPASLALRFIRPKMVGVSHAMATAVLTMFGTLFFAMFITRDLPLRPAY